MNITSIPYTLCFCIISDSVLLLHRNSNPNQNLWNGIGGKIEKKETIIESLSREVKEEANIDLSSAEIDYTGIVCWNTSDKQLSGMYCFITHLLPDSYFKGDQLTKEGILSWKKLDWVFDPNNKKVVSNIPKFLSHMLRHGEPHLYTCSYKNNILEAMNIEALPKAYYLE